MTDPQSPRQQGGDPLIGRLLRDAYRTSVDVEVAARHLWRLHHVAGAPVRRGLRRTLVSALAAVLVFAGTAAAVAMSGDAVPGDSLYVVKRGAERMHLLVSFAPESDARLHLRFARSRADEAQRMAASRPERVPVLLAEIVEAVDRAEVVGGRMIPHEVALVREEVSTALSALHPVLAPELAASVDATVRHLHDGRAVSGGGDAPSPPPDTPPPDTGADEGREPAGDPGSPAASGAGGATESPQPSEPPSEPPGEEPSEPPSEPPGEEPSEPPSEPPPGQRDPPPSEPSGAASQPPPREAASRTDSAGAGAPEDTSVPVLDRLESLLADPDAPQDP